LSAKNNIEGCIILLNKGGNGLILILPFLLKEGCVYMFWRKKKKIVLQESLFKNALTFADEIIDNSRDTNFNRGQHPIFDMLKILVNKVQSDYMMKLLKVDNESDLESIIFPFWFEGGTILTEDGLTFNDLIKEATVNNKADLKYDMFLPWPWKRQRLINTISFIGSGRKLGSWTEDKMNHYLTLCLPLGIHWVDGGNHSLSVGVLQGDGQVTPKHCYDITQVYDYVYCDGEYFYRTIDNKKISEVKNIELAMIFEIGRKMIGNSIE
jgi:hypothetical protein